VRVWDRLTGKLLLKIPDDLESKEIPDGVYLGVPLIDGDRVYLVYEQAGALRVRCLSMAEYRNSWKPGVIRSDEAGKIWDYQVDPRGFRPLAVTRDVHCRTHATWIVRAGPNIIVPTPWFVTAMDAETGERKWVQPYLQRPPRNGLETVVPAWVVVPPVVVGDKYLYSPADFPELLCLNVADGKKVWSAKKGDGLYPAVVGERVLVIGEKTVRSLALKDGSEQWKADLPGLPCGRGAVLGDTYLVPVSEPKTWKGLIAVVDLKAGKVVEVLRSEKDEPIGNLVVHQDFLISQTLTEIAVFPIKKKE
jgi:outer membrane protein assembly factor BamB